MKTSRLAAPLLCLPLSTLAQNILVNGGFETGDLTGWTVLPEQPQSEIPWATVTQDQIAEVRSDDQASGKYSLFAAGEALSPDTPFPDLPVIIEQTFATTPGQGYDISMDVNPGPEGSLYAVYYSFEDSDGTESDPTHIFKNIYTAPLPNGIEIPFDTYTIYRNFARATSDSATLLVAVMGTGVHVDNINVSVSEAPEPSYASLCLIGLIGAAYCARRSRRV